MSSDLKRVSGLWLKDGRNGKFMSGETDTDIPAGTRLLVFKNTKKVEGDKQPDYILNVAPEDPGYGGRHSGNGDPRGSQTKPVQRQQPASIASTSAGAPPPPTEDSIPF